MSEEFESPTATATATPDLFAFYGNHEFAISSLPPASLVALVQRGLSHFLSTEVNSRLVAAIRAEIVATGGESAPRKLGDVTSDAIRDFREDRPEWVEAKQAELVQAAVDAIRAGTLVRERAPRDVPGGISGVERRARALAWSTGVDGLPSLESILVSNGIKPPKGTSTVTIGGQAFSRDDLIDRRLAKAGDALRALATAQLESERAAKAQAKSEARTNPAPEASLAELI